MTIHVEDGLLPYLRRSCGGIVLHVSGAADPTAVRKGLAAAMNRIASIRHPDEPDEPFAKLLTSNDSEIHAELPDADAYDGILEEVLASVVAGLGDAGVDDATVHAGPDPKARPVQAARHKKTFKLPAGFPVPDGGESFHWDDSFHDDGGVRFNVRAALADVVAFYSSALPAAGFDLVAKEPVCVHSPPGELNGTKLSFRGRGWRGTTTMYLPTVVDPVGPSHANWVEIAASGVVQVEIALRADLSVNELRGSASGRVSARRRYSYDTEALSKAAFLIRPDDLPGTWTGGYGPFRATRGRFCWQDTVIRKGPTTRPPARGAQHTLLSSATDPVWIQQDVEAYADATLARQEWAWVPLDLAECAAATDFVPIGTHEAQGSGSWREVRPTAATEDVFAAELIFDIPGEGRVVGRKAVFIVDRFVGSLFVHGAERAAAPDLWPLVNVAATRLRAVAEEFPSLQSPGATGD